VPMTCADITRIGQDYDYAPKTGIREGLEAFVAWFEDFQAGRLESRAAGDDAAAR